MIRHNITKQISRIGESAKDFSLGLYEDHLFEISYYYNQRVIDMDDPYFTWLDVEHAETRIDTHIEALKTDEKPAMDYCRMKAEKVEPGIVYATVRLLCHHMWDQGLMEILESPNTDQPNYAKAVTDAFISDLPEEWNSILRRMIISENPAWKRIAADTLAVKLIPMEDELMEALKSADPDVLPAIIRAVGRLRLEKARHILTGLSMEKTCDETVYQTCLALLRIHEKEAVRIVLERKTLGRERYLLMGLSGDDRYIPRLRKMARSEDACDESLFALFLLGDISSMDELIDCLENDCHPKAAALSLYMLTGAALYETVFISEPLDEDRLFKDEVEKLHNNTMDSPLNEAGETITRLSQNPHIWRNWWYENKRSFVEDLRYRLGKPISKEGLLQVLLSEELPSFLRDLVHEELVIRYDTALAFDTSQHVKDQRDILDVIKRKWVNHGQ